MDEIWVKQHWWHYTDKENWHTGRKTWSSATLSTINPTWTGQDWLQAFTMRWWETGGWLPKLFNGPEKICCMHFIWEHCFLLYLHSAEEPRHLLYVVAMSWTLLILFSEVSHSCIWNMQTLHTNTTQHYIIPGKRHPNLDLLRWELCCL